jgi:AraC-like DNA-binding protein
MGLPTAQLRELSRPHGSEDKRGDTTSANVHLPSLSETPQPWEDPMASGNDRSSGLLVHSSAGPPVIAAPALRSADVDGVDVLSDVLRAVRLSGALFFLTDASSPWSIAVPSGAVLNPAVLPRAQHLISYHVVTRGRCWCEAAGASRLRLDTGDVVVVPHGDAYQLSCPAGEPCTWSPGDVLTFFRSMAAGELPFVVTEGGGGPDRLEVLCGFLGCDLAPFNPVLGMLPPLLHVPCAGGADDDRLNHLADIAMAEARERRPGTETMLLRIAELMFVEVIRRYITAMAPGQRGWLAGLRDPLVARALALLHRQADRRWTLVTLAREVGVSRSVLADRFAHLVGVPPMQYFARWRIQLATRLLAESQTKVAAVASAVGYESEAAFNRAFSRAVGVPPATWRRRNQQGPSSPS